NVTTLNATGNTHYNVTVLYPHNYFVMASSNIVNGVTVGAYYSDASQTAIVPANIIPIQQSGGVRIVSQGVYESAGMTVDAIGWGRHVGPPYGPNAAREDIGFKFSDGASHNGLDWQTTLQRIASATSTATSMSLPAGSDIYAGNAYDS